MNSLKNIAHSLRSSIAGLIILASSGVAFADSVEPLVDDFNDAQNNSLGLPRQFMNDTMAGGQTSTEQTVKDGVFTAKGEIVPPRGQPGWASSILLLDPAGAPVDASAYEGIRLRLRINKGMISVSANSTEITNFDYHAAIVTRKPGDDFQEVKIPFDSMKRAWSEQTPLNAATLNSISIVAVAMQKDTFEFELDEVSFY
ncbi:CIA30 family protein [Pelagicoccus mobilis]|uniref:CIA30 family protein n=1 Tax=Pelagicoccus mobilis TaxID=415221 RepID=A0A934VUH3_9BACT|nr:CIA30 family protein [Pelagicoccus mobilis]MBK1880534.1 CIA30 family protein [Pelagicoccus mobilis]